MDSTGAGQTVISEDVEITGTVSARNNLRVDGKLNGDLNCVSDVTLGKASVIKGNINASGVTVEGSITGNVSAKDRVALKAAAKISGDVKARRMTMEDGVTYVGKLEINPGPAAGLGAGQQGAGDQTETDEERRKSSSFFGRK